jgi:hypothetical protein
MKKILKPSELEILIRQRAQLKLQKNSLKYSRIYTDQEKNDLMDCYQKIIEVINEKINELKKTQ